MARRRDDSFLQRWLPHGLFVLPALTSVFFLFVLYHGILRLPFPMAVNAFVTNVKSVFVGQAIIINLVRQLFFGDGRDGNFLSPRPNREDVIESDFERSSSDRKLQLRSRAGSLDCWD